MGDYKCKSGIGSDSRNDINEENDRSNDYSKNNITDSSRSASSKNDWTDNNSGDRATSSANYSGRSCGSGIKSDNQATDAFRSEGNETRDYNSRDYVASDTQSKYDTNDRYDSKSQYDTMSDEDEGCGCGTGFSGSVSDSGYTDDLQYPDDAQTATIYSETIVFGDADDLVDDDLRTSSLISDEEEGSEFMASDPTRPQC